MKKAFIYLGGLLMLLFFVYVTTPTIAYGFMLFPILILVSGGGIQYFLSKSGANENSKYSKILPIFLGLVAGYLVLANVFSSWALFHSDDYRNLIGTVKEGKDFSERIAPISTEDIRIVDKGMARRLGDKMLGSKPALGSQTDLGEFSIQSVNGKLYWVAPLLHSGFFKWLSNGDGTPGYVMVSANNERDVRLVGTVGGAPVRIKYQPNAYFFDNLYRHTYFDGNITRGLTDFTFEIDDNGKPYWVITGYKKKIGFSGNEAEKVIVMDPATGDTEYFDIDKAPAWIDRIQPEHFIASQLKDWGEYVHGYWNFSNQGKLTITDGLTLVYGSNGKSYWYTGLTSVGADDGTVGFALVDTRTKQTTWYPLTGATEEAARQSAMGKVQEKGYEASFPVAYNINNVPTYVMSLKDNAGLVKMIAMVSVQDYSIVGVGANVKEALRDYKGVLNGKGNAIATSSNVASFEIETEVVRVGADTRNGNTFYYMILKGFENKVFVGGSTISNEIPITTVGDRVKVSYDDGGNELVDINSFDNLEFQLQKTEGQQKLERYFEATAKANIEK
ncbi:hypothetical protein FUAX_38410 (plasmid) [Fulvitalea axinellae]|uniref:Cell shape-determining protein n=1 Tax=Fulvitalea axinellae TaxID=1182444 RepID=A0AAU9CY19_9BACT|nr:hypothetical protein FUAX_38410 [Fulvitalea axinellae]